MAQFPAIPLWTDAFLADCSHLSDAETGLYIKILIQLWRAPGQKLPLDPAWLARKFSKTLDEVQSQVMPLIHEFCQSDAGRNSFTQKRLVKEFKYVTAQRSKQAARAKSRWEKQKGLSRGNATPCNAPTPTPTPTLSLREDSSQIPIEETSLPSEISCLPAEKISLANVTPQIPELTLDGGDVRVDPFALDLRTVNGRSIAITADAVFEAHIWPNFPKERGNKKPAMKAFRKALKTATARDILDGVMLYGQTRNDEDPQFTLRCSTWLNAEGWRAELEERERLAGIQRAIAETLAKPPPERVHT